MKTAFTLLELLVVIAIIGILAAAGLPAIRGMTRSNATISANRQMLDAINYARQRAMSDHTTVYLVFIPPAIADPTQFPLTTTDPAVLGQYTNLWGGQYTTYAMISLRSVGDQPGRSTPHYLGEWRTLPNGVFIAANKFAAYNAALPTPYGQAFHTNAFPFPLVSSNATTCMLPCVGFDYLGRLVSQQDEAIPLARGSIFYARDGNGHYLQQVADVLETPLTNSLSTSNVIYINALTGRAQLQNQQIQ